LDQWVRLAVAVLAHTTRKAALATPPRAREIKFKHLELISLRDTLILLVLVVQGGTVKQQMLTLDQPMDQESLSRLSNQLNEQCKGLTGSQISARLAATSGWASQIGQFISEVMGGVDTQSTDALYRDGLMHILDEPEFAEGGQVRQMVQTLEGSSLVDVVMAATEPLGIGGVQVLIGGEGKWHDFSELSLVLSRYGVEGEASGLLGVIGPLRMSYDHTIGAVRYVSQLMSDLVSDWYDVRGGTEYPLIS